MLTISEAATATGLSVHTLRYYERAGLLPAVTRADSGHRRYAQTDLEWLDFLSKMRATGMPIRELRAYVQLAWDGDRTLPERLERLERHREEVRAHVAELQGCLDLLDYKIAMYRERSTTS